MVGFVLLIGTTLAWVVFVSGAAAQSDFDSFALDPLSIVVLIDESGSLTDEDVQAEARAAALLASIEVSEDSTVAVMGFGSRGTDSTSLAVEDYCAGLQRLESEGARQRIESCAARASPRTSEEGFHTDHYNALREALDVLETRPSNSRPVIFLLTDGVLFPGPNSGLADPGSSTVDEDAIDRAWELLRGEIGPRARQMGVQIRPLGFGPDVDRATLEEYASLGSGSNEACESLGREPKAVIVDSASDVLQALLEAVADTRCQGLSLGTTGTTSSVSVSTFATDGSVAAARPNRQTSVTFEAPDGTTLISGEQSPDDRYSIIETETAVAVRFADVQGGAWTVTSNAPLSPFGLWEARVQAWIEGPSQADAGTSVELRIRLRDRTGVVTDFGPNEMANFSLGAEDERGSEIPLSELVLLDGGEIQTSFVMPDCPTTVAVDTALSIEGFVDVSEPITIPCDESSGFFVELSSSCVDLPPAGSVPVLLSYSNQSGTSKQLSVGVDQASPAGWKVINRNTFEIASGSSGDALLEVSYTGGQLEGEFVGRVVATDTTTGAEKKATATLCGQAVPEEGNPWPRRFGLGVLLSLVGLLLRSRRREVLNQTDGLIAQLHANGVVLSEIDGAGAPPFTFSISERRGSPCLEIGDSGDATRDIFSVSRRVRGIRPSSDALRISQPDGETVQASPATLSTGRNYRGYSVELVIIDERQADVEEMVNEDDQLEVVE